MKDGVPLLVEVDGTEIGLLRHRGRLYAFRNSCPHQGGPIAEGDLVGNAECSVLDAGTRLQSSSIRNFSIACPWHGIDYDLETGVCRSDKRMKLKSYEVAVDDGFVTVRV